MADKILLIDDEPHVLSILAMKLRDNDFEVFQASSADEGQKILEKENPELLVLDLNMPHKSGLEFAKELRAQEKYARIPIIFLSAIEDREAIASALIEGGTDYITKPFNIDDVIKKIYDALRQ